jgi:hypothetical protein
VILPEGSVNPSGFQETLDMPCRILHTSTVGGGMIYEIRMRQREHKDPCLSDISPQLYHIGIKWQLWLNQDTFCVLAGR